MSEAHSSVWGRALCHERRNASWVVWISLVTFLAFGLRTIRLDLQPLWWDEGWSLYFATADVPAMVARTAIDIHPPFYYLVLHIWTLIAGSSATSVRLFSVLVGTLSVPMIFLAGRRLFGARAAIMAALTMAVAPFHVYYSQEARMYALVTFLVLCSIYLFVSLLEREGAASSSGLHWLLYVAVTSVAMYTQYYAVFVPLSQTLFILARFRRYRRLVVKWLGAQLALFLLYLPWLVYAGGKLLEYVGTKMVKEGDVPLGLYTYFQRHLVAFSVGHVSGSRQLLWWTALIFIGLIMLGIVGYLRRRPVSQSAGLPVTGAVDFTLIYLSLPLCLGYLINLRYPFSSTGIQRLFLLSAPGFYLLVALGLAWLWERLHLLWPACLLLVAVNLLPLWDFYTGERYPDVDYRPLIARVQALARPEDVIVAVHPWQIGYFHAYYSGPLPSLYLTPKEATDVTSEQWAADPGLMAQQLDHLLTVHRFLWFPAHQALGRILETDVEGYLSQRYYPLFGEWFGESTRLSCYTGGAEQNATEKLTNFGDKIALLSYGLTSRPVEAAWDAVPIDLRWRITGELDGEYQIALRLTDQEGQTWAARDSAPVAGLRPFHEERVGSEIADRHGLLIPAGTPPGVYDLRLGLYHLRDRRSLDILDGEGTPQGVEAVLGTVEIDAPSSPPAVQSLLIDSPRQVDFGRAVRFLGYSLKSDRLRAGDTLEITLFWQALADLDEDYQLTVQLQGEGGRSYGAIEQSLSHPAYPTSSWRQGELVRGLHRLAIPASALSNGHCLILGVNRAVDGQPLSVRRWGVSWGDTYRFCPITVEARPHQTQPPASIGYRMSMRLGETARFLGYDLDRQQVSAGDSLHLTLYWQALAETSTSYTVFTHLIDDQNRIWGQKDSIPGKGSMPTTGWLPGEYITDQYEITVRPDTPTDSYVIEVGMYDATTMIRLPVFDAQGTGIGDRILLEATPVDVSP